MRKKITKKELIENLNNLKRMLKILDYSKFDNIIFYNFDSYIKYVNRLCPVKKGAKSIEKILKEIEMFIPFEFDEKTIDFLITHAIDDYNAEEFQSILIKRAKVDFINSVKLADNQKKWGRIISKCKNIYEYHDSNTIYG